MKHYLLNLLFQKNLPRYQPAERVIANLIESDFLRKFYFFISWGAGCKYVCTEKENQVDVFHAISFCNQSLLNKLHLED